MQHAAAAALRNRGQARAELAASGASPEVPDRIIVTLNSGLAPGERSALSTAVVQALDRVAIAHGLARTPFRNGNNGEEFSYRTGSRTSQLVSLAVASPPQAVAGAGHAKLAIILDDLGSDERAAQEIFALPYPLTLSVLPGHTHSAEIAAEAHRRGYEVMLHLPMEAQGREHPEATELHPGMPPQEVAATVEQFLSGVPFAAGVNNHQGSQATSDPALMAELMPMLRDRNLFYVDSRTTTATVAFDTARQNGVRAAFRNVPFLDDVADRSAIRRQVELAFRGALRKEEALAIGHPHPETLAVLKEMLPRAAQQGIQLVFASQLAH